MAAAAAKLGGAAARGTRALWFRYDLRLDDNPALLAAIDGAAALLPVYVFDLNLFNRPTLAGARKSSARRARFMIESVANLRKQLEAKGSGLAVALGRPEDALPGLCGGFETVCVQQGVCSEEQTQEVKVAKHLRGCQLKRVWGGTLYMPDECGCSPDNAPLLFTSFKNKAEGRGRIRNPSDAPKRLPPLPEMEGRDAMTFMPTLQELGYPQDEAEAALEDDPRGVMKFEGGEEAALRRLQKWMFEDDKLKDYFEIRNGMLGDGYSSKLSPWLALGCISPRRIWKEAQRYEQERGIKNKSTYWLIFELTWRDFFVYMGRSQGDKIFVPGGVVGDRTPWRKAPDALAKWKEGRTNDPLVDANMRELKATGFMSNRGRQNVASYLIFDLGVDWRYGAAHFEEHLLDYDPCSNWGNWVAAAGLTGQRINKFNTRKQLSDYDPKREYVRHWLDGPGAAASPSSAAGARAQAADADEEAKRRARAERFGLGKGQGKGAEGPGKGSGKGGGYPSGKGGRGKGGHDGGVADGADRKKGRWRKMEEPAWQAQGA